MKPKFYLGILIALILTVGLVGFAGYKLYADVITIPLEAWLYALPVFLGLFILGWGFMRFFNWCFETVE